MRHYPGFWSHIDQALSTVVTLASHLSSLNLNFQNIKWALHLTHGAKKRINEKNTSEELAV